MHSPAACLGIVIDQGLTDQKFKIVLIDSSKSSIFQPHPFI